MGIITEEYFKTYEEMTKKYGKIALLIQKGKFYELYETPINNTYVDDILNIEDEEESIGNAREIAYILNMTCTFEDKSKKYSRNNCRLAGFPTVSYDKNKEILLQENFTVIRMDEVKKGDVINRVVKEIITPSIHISDKVSNKLNVVNNNLMCIYIEYQKYGTIKGNFDDYIITSGVSIIDLATGKNEVCEMHSVDNNSVNAVQEIYRFILSHPCKEIILYIEDMPDKNDGYISYLIDNLDLSKIDKFIFKVNEINKEMLKIEYQTAFLKKIFNVTYSNIIEALGLDMHKYGLISYILICQYCYETSPNILGLLNPPLTSWTDEGKHCILTHNAIMQLDLLPNKSKGAKSKMGNKMINSLLSVVDFTKTMMGRRYLKNMLLNPILNTNELETLYSMTEELISSYSDENGIIYKINKSLNGIYDVERLHRKIIMNTIQPNEIVQLIKSYEEMLNIISVTYHSDSTNLKNLYPHYFPANVVNNFNEYYRKLIEMFDMEGLSTAVLNKATITCTTNIFKTEQTSCNYFSLINKNEEQLNIICDHLNTFLQKSKGEKVHVEGKKTDDSDNNINKFIICCTQAKANTLKTNIIRINEELCGKLEFINTNSKTIITSPTINKICQELEYYKNEYHRYLYQLYTYIIEDIKSTCICFNNISYFISVVDYITGNAKCAIKYKYFRPIIDTSNNISYIDVEELRHPIIEQIITDRYVPNDIKLNNKNDIKSDNNKSGILLYGLNSSGKSSLAKSLGICIIMAQAGMFVPGKLKYRPYNKIITRLSGEDDIYKGHSSFIVEMSELRTILRNADCNTLVLGDELCKGTESVSGTALTAATLIELINRNTTFIFSTHLHELINVKEMKTIGDNIKILHLSTFYDETTKHLAYNRNLNEGPGESIYGLEVAKWLGLDEEFIRSANNIRKNITNESNMLLNTKTSKYNSKIYVDQCTICKSKISLHVHHIEPQKAADENNFIGYYHKNSSFNLIVVCEKCHNNIHKK